MARIQTDKFMQLCRTAIVPVLKTEKAILEEVDGDKDRFLKECHDRGVPVTRHEKELLNATPYAGDDDIEYMEGISVGELKMDMAKIKAMKIRGENVYDYRH